MHTQSCVPSGTLKFTLKISISKYFESSKVQAAANRKMKYYKTKKFWVWLCQLSFYFHWVNVPQQLHKNFKLSSIFLQSISSHCMAIFTAGNESIKYYPGHIAVMLVLMKETLDIAFLKGPLWGKVCMCADGGPRSRVFARKTLRSAPHWQ